MCIDGIFRLCSHRKADDTALQDVPKLPSNVLRHIIFQLDICDQLNFSRCSKRFQKVVNKKFWRKIAEERMGFSKKEIDKHDPKRTVVRVLKITKTVIKMEIFSGLESDSDLYEDYQYILKQKKIWDNRPKKKSRHKFVHPEKIYQESRINKVYEKEIASFISKRRLSKINQSLERIIALHFIGAKTRGEFESEIDISRNISLKHLHVLLNVENPNVSKDISRYCPTLNRQLPDAYEEPDLIEMIFNAGFEISQEYLDKLVSTEEFLKFFEDLLKNRVEIPNALLIKAIKKADKEEELDGLVKYLPRTIDLSSLKEKDLNKKNIRLIKYFLKKKFTVILDDFFYRAFRRKTLISQNDQKIKIAKPKPLKLVVSGSGGGYGRSRGGGFGFGAALIGTPAIGAAIVH